MIYLDNNATTPLAPEVREAMLPHLSGEFGNPSSPHAPGMAAKRAVGEARARVAALVGAKAADILFTASATEANHTALLGTLRAVAAERPERRHLVTTAIEHPSTLMLAHELERQGWRVTVLPVDGTGTIALADLRDAVTPDTALVSVMWANNETGAIQPVGAAADIAQARGALFHTDAVQAAGRLPIKVDAVNADLLTLSAHKMHGPKGIGALFIRRGVPFAPLIHGHQERHRRGGTENVPAIVGFGAAAARAAATVAEAGGMAILRDRLERGVLAAWPGSRVNGEGAVRLSNTSNIRFADPQGRPLDAEELLMRLDRAGIAVSMGSACASGGNEPSHVLTAMGLSPAEAAASLRFSLSRCTTAEEVESVLNEFPALYARMAA
ncbi:aminotransferase class V-fold PLP-dependent enzyme [Azospirillum brasilense]|uniref:Cysteine desulfurase n=1 Tax=Azospirillum brasilense TaxID=192 RepID=A0A0P0F530_AZOBR|nr:MULTISPECIES: aminotransferase class V-fold PLP-dependent enzyme [Azospirillum]ALJ34774.1 cysteine desulfurase NifS [Azospirillum brasilense]MDW7554687.1 aminotransferase class V-fold PLP-dependent enzyme [Azospirillum brasilense]MDW7593190.1 aminotransferase class V-fold PLP-dependent enzyme [Azospirillum brasilense]MDW7626859.1 aminotransferase class V-fold PLP-dependent enzyme [Azospirillum brasilense]MDX5953437.1 aminotransferase class V-fold PLP-dependent enzyme [Azospirillum brasilens